MSLSLWQMMHTCTYLAVSTNRTFTAGQSKTHSSSINSLFTLHVWLFGVEWQTLKSQALTSLKTKMAVQLRSHMLNMLKCYGTSPHQNWVVAELSSRPHGSSKIVQLPLQWDHLWRLFRKYFRSMIFSLHRELPWPACSPDFSACNYFLWGYFNVKVYATIQQIINDLKIAIQKKISVIP
jgi:hypothetical protein